MRALIVGLCGLMLAAPIASDFATAQPVGQVLVHKGMCEASAAVAFPQGSFGDRFVVANDEDNVLRVYSAGTDGGVIGKLDLPPALLRIPDTRPSDERKADIEAAAWLGGRVYWIGSHSRTDGGRVRESRWQFLATTADQDGLTLGTELRSASLLEPLREFFARRRDDRTLTLERDDPIGGRDQNRDLGSESGGLNIEGLAARAGGTSLLLGLRGPRTSGRTVLIPLLNPAEVVERGATPSFGDPISLDLDNRGIRSLEYSEARGEYLIVAGPMGDPDDPRFDLYGWNGRPEGPPRLVLSDPETLRRLVSTDGFRPEAMIVNREGTAVQVFSDDGGRCSSAPEFRSVVLPLRPAAP